MKKSVAEASQRGMPIYGECGGLMYLARSLECDDGKIHEMGRRHRCQVIHEQHVRTIGYVLGKFERDTPIGLNMDFLQGP